MREILFRGKCKETKVWYTGYYINLHRTTYCFKEDYDNDKNNDIHQIVFEQMTDWGLPNRHLRVDIIPETVGQYTGSTDKNGTKIFEGDIVEFYFFDKGHKNKKTMLIEWRDSGFCMRELFRDYRLADDFTIIDEKIFTYRNDVRNGVYITNNVYFVEVIGNIHDNPELLESEVNNNV